MTAEPSVIFLLDDAYAFFYMFFRGTKDIFLMPIVTSVLTDLSKSMTNRGSVLRRKRKERMTGTGETVSGRIKI